MAPKLYMCMLSPPVRAVMLCAANIGVKLDLIETNVFKSDPLPAKFLELNPVHTIPVLDDDGLVICDSHAIMCYLVEKYAKDKSLYPEDIKRRALINQRLYFETGILFARTLRMCFPIFHNKVSKVSEENINVMNDAYGYIEAFLQNSKYIAGDELCIADFSMITTITHVSIVVPIDESKYPKLTEWRKRMETIPHYEIDKTGGDMARAILEPKLRKFELSGR